MSADAPRPPAHPLRPAVLALIRGGCTLSQAARLTGAAHSSVRRWAREAGLGGGASTSPLGARRERGLELLSQGLSDVEVAVALSVSRELVRRWRDVYTQPKQQDQRREALDGYLRAGLPPREAAARAGVTVSTAYRRLGALRRDPVRFLLQWLRGAKGRTLAIGPGAEDAISSP